MILAIDPGGTTGVAYQLADGQIDFEEIPGGDLGFDIWLEQLEAVVLPNQIVCESFIPRGGAISVQYDALYIIGNLRAWCRRFHIPFKLQTPGQAKGFATNDKLKAAGYYPKGLGHAQDAARHLLTHLVNADPAGALARKIAVGLGL